MEPDEADFDRLIMWLEAQARSDRMVREVIKNRPAPPKPTAKIIPFPLRRRGL
jgi:hypothetical protein